MFFFRLIFATLPIAVYSLCGFELTDRIGNIIPGEESSDQSGGDHGVAISADGTIVAIGAKFNDGGRNDAGHVRVYEFVGGDWTQLGSDIDGEWVQGAEQSGSSVSLSADGHTVAIGSKNYGDIQGRVQGRVRVLEWNGVTWVQMGGYILGSTVGQGPVKFGHSVDLSADGKTVAIGAPMWGFNTGDKTGYVGIHHWNGAGWVKYVQNILYDGQQGSQAGTSVSLSGNGQIVAIGIPYMHANSGNWAGSVKVYNISGTSWRADEMGDLHTVYKTITSYFDSGGFSVSLSFDGETVAVGAWGEDNPNNVGFAHIFDYSGGSWIQRGGEIRGNEQDERSSYSVSLSADGNVVALGAPQKVNVDAGIVRVYEWNDPTWICVGYRNSDADKNSGSSVALSYDGTSLAIGAPNPDKGSVEVVNLESVITPSSYCTGYVSSWSSLMNCISNTDVSEIYILQDLTHNGTDLIITREVTIYGNEHAIDGNKNRILTIESGGNVMVREMTFYNGRADGGNSPLNKGGAVYNEGTMSLHECTFNDNSASNEGGAVYNNKAGGTMSLYDCTFNDNSARYGGALENYGEIVDMERCVFTRNTVTTDGGAIENYGQVAIIQNIVNCTFTVNGAARKGGAVYNSQSAEIQSITGCKFECNYAPDGSAIYNDGAITSVLANSVRSFPNNEPFKTPIATGFSIDPTECDLEFLLTAKVPEIVLENDVVYEEPYIIPIDWDLDIDGNGHDLTAMFSIGNGANVVMRNVRLHNVKDDGTFFDIMTRRLTTAIPDYGAIQVSGGASLNLADMEVTNCIAAYGAGVYIKNGTVNLQNVTFENNAALGGVISPAPVCEGGCGGAVYSEAAGMLTCEDSSFHFNYALGYGGAVATNGPSEFNECGFRSNYGLLGGAVAAQSVTNFNDCNFECNWCQQTNSPGCSLFAGPQVSNTSNFTLSPWSKSEVFPQRLFDENAVDGGQTCDDGMQEVLDELRAYLNETGDWSELQDWLENRTIDHFEDWLNARHNATIDHLEELIGEHHNDTIDHLEELIDERHNDTIDEVKELIDERHNDTIDEVKELIDERHNDTVEHLENWLDVRHNLTIDELEEWMDERQNQTRDELVEWIDERHNHTRDELVEWIDDRHNQTRDEMVEWIDVRHNTTRDELVEWIDSRHNMTRDELIAFFEEELQKTNDLIVEEFKEQKKTILQPLYSLLWTVVWVGLIGGFLTALYLIVIKPSTAGGEGKDAVMIGALSMSRIHKQK